MCDSNCGCGCNSTKVPRGPQGIPGIPATIELGDVNTGDPGTDVIITNSGTTDNDAIFNFTIPRGDQGIQGPPGPNGTGTQGPQGVPGIAATIAIGSTNTGLPGTNASVTAGGTPSAVLLNFVIPRGATGSTGAQGPKGDAGTGGFIYPIFDGTTTPAQASRENQYLRRKTSNDGYEFVNFSQMAADNQFHINNLGFNQF
jgi:hypothetical protein